MMWDVIELAMMPRLPSEIAETHYGVDFRATSRIGFDRGMLWFKHWVESKQRETVNYTPDKNAKPQRPKYSMMSEIFDLYDNTWDASKFAAGMDVAVDMEAVIESAYADDVLF